MRVAQRRVSLEEEEESAFVSMTDLTVGFLFIIMILLVFFISYYSSVIANEDNVPRAQYDKIEQEKKAAEAELREAKEDLDKAREEIERQQEMIARFERELAVLKKRRFEELEERDPLEAYLARAADARFTILKQLRDRIRADFPDLLVEISAENDALRFPSEGLFDSGKYKLAARPKRIVDAIAERLDEILPCYTLGQDKDFGSDCNPNAALIEAVQIEGHTDDEGSNLYNLGLSTDRANATFTAMISDRPDLMAHQNRRDQPVLSVAGYGKMRPLKTNDTDEGRAANRRIDLRIIMYTPTSIQEIEKIRQRLADPLREPSR